MARMLHQPYQGVSHAFFRNPPERYRGELHPAVARRLLIELCVSHARWVNAADVDAPWRQLSPQTVAKAFQRILRAGINRHWRHSQAAGIRRHIEDVPRA